MPITSPITSETILPHERDHSACGVSLIVNIPQAVQGGAPFIKTSRDIVLDGLTVLTNFNYRSGFNPVTEESDGAGIHLYGLATQFFNKKIQANEFISPINAKPLHLTLEANHFAIGQYFLSPDKDKMMAAKQLIEASARVNRLLVVGWRDLNDKAINTPLLSTKSQDKKPAIWQAILIQAPVAEASQAPFDLEHAVQKTSIYLANQARINSIPIHVVSQSSQSIVYKGMVPPPLMAGVYLDLQDEDFTAAAITVHARFATNTDPQWANAQPCPNFIAHNGEFNSAPANAKEMRQALSANPSEGIYPIKTLSDSMQFDTDLLNQVMKKGISLAEAFVRLMPPPASPRDNNEILAMLKCFKKERSPYNGPAFVVASYDGYYLAKLDECGLRPSRWGIILLADGTRQFHAASDDYLIAPKGGVIITTGHLKPGGMILITPQGDIHGTNKILKEITLQYHQQRQIYFQMLYKETTCQLQVDPPSLFTPSMDEASQKPLLSSEPSAPPINPKTESELQRVLYAAGWDSETISQVLCPLAEKGLDPTAAMGDDTNPLYATQLPPHLSYFFHQLFAQVSAPPIDSIRERKVFTLETTVGPKLGSIPRAQQIALASPILSANELLLMENHPQVKSTVLDLSFPLPGDLNTLSTGARAMLLSVAIQHVLHEANKAIAQGAGILILSDRYTEANRALIPDLLIVAALRQHLESTHQSNKVSIVADSYQLSGPHQAAALLALGANAVYARGAYEKINALYPEDMEQKQNNYQYALEKCLLKTMGKIGITDVNNYINGQFMAALGLDLSPDQSTVEENPSLSNIFPGLYSPLKGIHLGHVANKALQRHANAHDPEQDFLMMPRSGYYMPEKNGVKHGYGPEVINAFTAWRKEEELRAELWQLDHILDAAHCPDFITDRSIFSSEQGFLDPRKKNEGHPKGLYPLDYLEQLKPSPAFRVLSEGVDHYKRKHPTCIRDYFSIKNLPSAVRLALLGLDHEIPHLPQNKADILRSLFSGSMSQGALTPKAHEMLTRGVNAVHAMSGSGEGGEAMKDLRNPITSTRSKQIASGRFGVSAKQIACATEIEIKIAQGAKPGEGGELPGEKVTKRFAAQRGGLPGTHFISPPPHHDIYSIEDLEELITDIKAANPAAIVVVKLVASEGIGTIACGVAKAGADVINIASNSGGTAAAQQSSIKHAGLPGELGLAEVDKALRKAGLRDMVKLRTSGGLKTPDDIILSALLGADQFELGTTSMLLLGCEMQRTCNKSCIPGVAMDEQLFKGNQMNVERFFIHLAAGVQEKLRALGVPSLQALRGRTELIDILDKSITERYDFSSILDRSNLPAPLRRELLDAATTRRAKQSLHEKEDALVAIIKQSFQENPSGVFCSALIALTTQDRAFGARIAGIFEAHLESHPTARIILKTSGLAGQSFGFVMPKGMEIQHHGRVQDGCGKSMSGGKLALIAPQTHKINTNTIAGNAMLYGASGGHAFLAGRVGHRCGILMKGAELVVEGVGEYAFQYMTSGTGLILGKVGEGLCSGAAGGIVFVEIKGNPELSPSTDVRYASPNECPAYASAIQGMLQAHLDATGSVKAKRLLTSFDVARFKIVIPKAMDKINTLQDVSSILETYQMREAPLTAGMQVWLEQKIFHLLENEETPQALRQQFLSHLLVSNHALPMTKISFLSEGAQLKLKALLAHQPAEKKSVVSPQMDFSLGASVGPRPYEVKIHTKKTRPLPERLGNIAGGLDDLLHDAIHHLNAYVAELTTDATGCSGCRKNSCAGGDEVSTGCPSGKAINTINATLQKIGPINKQLTQRQWRLLREAFELQIQESPFIAYTGAACPAPCQDACTETIPEAGAPQAHKAGKHLGENVHIKDIEFYLYQIGRSLGWFDGRKDWSEEEIKSIFGHKEQKRLCYDWAMQPFKAAFSPPKKLVPQELIIVGSGPAAMQIAFEALRDGICVRMYEASDKPGGLLVDGIPAHKFDKQYIDEDFDRLKAMGLQLHLNSRVVYNNGDYMVNAKVISSQQDENHTIALCVGAGRPKGLPPEVIAQLDETANSKIVQAIDFLKIANDVAAHLRQHPEISPLDKEILIKQKFGSLDPRGKKIVVIGGGDTAQDVLRWVARYFNDSKLPSSQLEVLVRGPKPVVRGIQDGYPSQSLAPTKENNLRDEEVAFINGKPSHLVQPKAITFDGAFGKLKLHLIESAFKYYDEIQKDKVDLQKRFEALPRDRRPVDKSLSIEREIDQVDLIICALGFQGQDSIPLINAIKTANAPRVYIAGDASEDTTKIIVSAQANGKDTYQKMRAAMGILKQVASPLVDLSLFSPAAVPSLRTEHPLVPEGASALSLPTNLLDRD